LIPGIPLRVTGALALLVVLGPACAGAADAATPAAPRPVSAAERAAVEMVLEYARGGPAALWERLAEDAPLRALGRERAVGEIAARLGPAAGSSWRLLTPPPGHSEGRALLAVEFASGIDDTLVFELIDAGGWRLRELRCLVDPAPPADEGAIGAAAARPDTVRFATPRAGVAWAALLALAAALFATRRRALGAGIAASLALLSAVACARGGGDSARTETEPPALAGLQSLRRTLAAGTDAAAITRELAIEPADPRLSRVRDLWHAQLALVSGEIEEAERLIGPAPAPEAEPSTLPLERLLRARLGLERFDAGTAELYERALESVPESDAFRFEALVGRALTDAQAVGLEVETRLLVEMGSRMAEPWYAAAIDAARLEHDDESAELLRTGWRLRPQRRDVLLDDPALSAVVARPQVFPLLGLDSPREPVVEAIPGARALAPVGAATSSLCGAELRLETGSLELIVPGGADLAPVGVEAESAAERDRRIGERGLAARPAIRAAVGRGGTLGPRLNRLAHDAAEALAEARKWSELVALTEGPVGAERSSPQRLTRLRALALERVGRGGEALELLVALAERELGARRPAPGVLFDLADAFASRGDYERAIRLVQRADASLPEPRGDLRLRVFRMSRDLEAEARVHRSAHFDIRYPKGTGERYARQLATVFETERERLLYWIPRPGDRRVVIELFPFERFIQSYGGMAIGVTLADGPVRLPFADLRSLHPELVEILSHELAHALLDGATAGRAPRWFHEGLAQHVEMGIGPVNPLPDLVEERRNLSVPAIEPVIAGFSEPELVDIAYAESAWVVAFLEARWGIAALHRMQALFAADHDSESALTEVTGLPMVAFDEAFRRWALSGEPRPRSLAVRRFDLELDSPLVAEVRRADLPRVEAVRPVAPPTAAPSRAAGPAEMASWHRRYAHRAKAVRTAFAPVMSALQSGAATPDPRDCGRLADEADRLLAERDLLAAPDPGVASALTELYQGFSALGGSCRDGRAAEARQRFDANLGRLERATRALAPYGLRP
jgi:hypothetical protein